ncbi:SH3 domain-containing protein [Rhodotorula toruloides]|nr:SH3 domain-containing protein [Rhodotorula toruloides]
MSFLAKFKDTAQKVGVQATAFGQAVAQEAQSGSAKAMTSFKLESECTKAARILQSFLADPAHPESALNSIPKEVLHRAKGRVGALWSSISAGWAGSRRDEAKRDSETPLRSLARFAIFTVLKAGFVWSGKAGSGVVIARLPDGTWSAPSCIATGGVGFGLQIGADLSEFVVVLNSDEALSAFAKGGNLTIGGSLAAAAGPIGVGGAVNTAILNPAPMFTYSKSKGLYAGVSLEGTVLVERKDANQAFYGQAIPALELLSGKVPPPEAASALYETIEAAESIDESGLPQQAYVVPEGTVGATAPLSTAGQAPAQGGQGGQKIFDATGA